MKYIMQCEKCCKPAQTIDNVKRRLSTGKVMINKTVTKECECGGKIIVVID